MMNVDENDVTSVVLMGSHSWLALARTLTLTLPLTLSFVLYEAARDARCCDEMAVNNARRFHTIRVIVVL